MLSWIAEQKSSKAGLKHTKKLVYSVKALGCDKNSPAKAAGGMPAQELLSIHYDDSAVAEVTRIARCLDQDYCLVRLKVRLSI